MLESGDNICAKEEVEEGLGTITCLPVHYSHLPDRAGPPLGHIVPPCLHLTLVSVDDLVEVQDNLGSMTKDGDLACEVRPDDQGGVHSWAELLIGQHPS